MPGLPTLPNRIHYLERHLNFIIGVTRFGDILVYDLKLKQTARIKTQAGISATRVAGGEVTLGLRNGYILIYSLTQNNLKFIKLCSCPILKVTQLKRSNLIFLSNNKILEVDRDFRTLKQKQIR